MEIADIKRRVVETIDRARREASDRRVRAADVAREYGVFLDQRAVQIFKQVANVCARRVSPLRSSLRLEACGSRPIERQRIMSS